MQLTLITWIRRSRFYIWAGITKAFKGTLCSVFEVEACILRASHYFYLQSLPSRQRLSPSPRKTQAQTRRPIPTLTPTASMPMPTTKTTSRSSTTTKNSRMKLSKKVMKYFCMWNGKGVEWAQLHITAWGSNLGASEIYRRRFSFISIWDLLTLQLWTPA